MDVALEFQVADMPSPDGAVTLFMPVWTPGSYMVREYARHIEGFAAHDRGGSALAWRKVAKNRFRIDPGPATGIRVSYAVYGHELTVRTADYTDQRAYWNGACVFLWPVGAPDLEAAIDVSMPDGWSLTSQLSRADGVGGTRLVASGLDALVDAPGLAGTPEVLEFEAMGAPHRFVLDGLDGVRPPDSLVPDTVRIVEEIAAIFGGRLPYEDYSFISLFADSGRGGLEHTHSSTLLAPRTTFSPRKDYEEFMGLVAHELFHAWNGKRMRPRDFDTFDYENETYTTLLWVVEGWTAYYDDHLCRRAGIVSADRYLEILSETIAKMDRTPGRLLHPLSTASFDAWIKLYRPDENSCNSTQSYYSHGALAALCLDLTIRNATDGRRSLDDAIAALFRSWQDTNTGFGRDDVVTQVSDAAGRDLGDLVSALVDGPFEPDLGAVLAPLGLRLGEKALDTPRLGIQLRAKDLVVESVITGSAAHRGLLSPGDEILAVNGLRVTRSNWTTVLSNVVVAGRELTVLVSRRGRITECRMAPDAEQTERRIERIAGAGPRELELRRGWLWEE